MSRNFSPANGAARLATNERGNVSRTLLLVLLMVIAGGGYVYYFTDLVRPARPAPKPSVQAQVKQPMPPRSPQQEGVQVAPTPGAPAAQVPAALPGAAPVPAPVAVGSPGGKPEPAKVASANASKSVPAPATAAPSPAKPAPAPAPGAKAVPTPAAVPAPKPAAPVAPAKVPPTPAKATTTAPVALQPAQSKPVHVAVAKPAAPVKPVTTVKKGKDHYTLALTNSVPERSLDEMLDKLRNSHLEPVTKTTVKATEPMKRLYIADFTDQDVADEELKQLKKLSRDAFLIANNGRYALYAGSYVSENIVESEVKRLQAQGLKPVVRKTEIPVKMAKVMVGKYADAKEAAAAQKKLKNIGLSSKVVKAGK